MREERVPAPHSRTHTMIVAVVKKIFPGERRVALVPALVPTLIKSVWKSASNRATAYRSDSR